MESFGVDDVSVGDRQVRVAAGRYRRAAYAVEPDASSASYLWAAAAITGGRVPVPGSGPGAAPGRRGLRRPAGADGRRRSSGARTASRCAGTGRAARPGRRHGATAPTPCPRWPRWPAFADSPTRITGVGLHPDQGDRPHRLPGARSCSGAGSTRRRSPTGCRSARGPWRATAPASARTTTTAWPWRWRCSACASRASRSTTRRSWPSRSPAYWAALGGAGAPE